MATEFRWLKTTVNANPKPGQPDWDTKELGYSKVLQFRETGWFGHGWEDVWTATNYVYIDEKEPAKVNGLVEDFTVTTPTKKVN